MTSPEEQSHEARRNALARRLQAVCEGGLEQTVKDAGGALSGFSCKLARGDCLITLRVEFDSGPMIGWVGGSDIASAMLKAQRQVRANDVRWKEDRWANGQT